MGETNNPEKQNKNFLKAQRKSASSCHSSDSIRKTSKYIQCITTLRITAIRTRILSAFNIRDTDPSGSCVRVAAF